MYNDFGHIGLNYITLGFVPFLLYWCKLSCGTRQFTTTQMTGFIIGNKY